MFSNKNKMYKCYQKPGGEHMLGNILWVTHSRHLHMLQLWLKNELKLVVLDFFKNQGRIVGRPQVPGSIGPGDALDVSCLQAISYLRPVRPHFSPSYSLAAHYCTWDQGLTDQNDWVFFRPWNPVWDKPCLTQWSPDRPSLYFDELTCYFRVDL